MAPSNERVVAVATRVLVVIASLALIGLIVGAVVVLRGGAAAPSPSPTPVAASGPVHTTTADGLKIDDTTVGTGAVATAESTVKAKYTGKLDDGTVFDSTDKHGGEAIEFPLSGVIKGWQEGIPGMRVGGKRTLVIPAELGYGAQGNSGIPPNSRLTFDIELVDVK
jgi:FKBP-type peptidyl-prolyl cis-trans isomerase